MSKEIKIIKDLKERNDKLLEQYRLRDLRCNHLEHFIEELEKENENLKQENKQLKEIKDIYEFMLMLQEIRRLYSIVNEITE